MYCVLEYLYRDAANWKTYGEALLAGAWSEPLTRQLEATLDPDRQFVAEEVGLPSLHDLHAATYGCEPDLDHGFHEFVRLRPATAVDLVFADPLFTVEEMVNAFLAAAGRWRSGGAMS